MFAEDSPRRALRQSSAQDFVHSATMSRRYIVVGLQFTVLVAMFLGTGVDLSFGQHPYDWHRSGSNNRDYEVGEDSQLMHGSKTLWPSSLYIKSIHPSPAGFGTLIQAIGADDYRGERLRMTGFVKTENIRGDGVGMWMRVDGKAGSNKVLSFYNMCDRPITGTTDWQKYEIILDVPKKSENILYGLLLHGTGQAWLQDVKFEIVDHKEHVSQLPRGGCLVFHPR